MCSPSKVSYSRISTIYCLRSYVCIYIIVYIWSYCIPSLPYTHVQSKLRKMYVWKLHCSPYGFASHIMLLLVSYVFAVDVVYFFSCINCKKLYIVYDSVYEYYKIFYYMLLRKRAQMDKSNKKKMGRACSLKALLGIIKTCTYDLVYICVVREYTH